MGVSVVRYQLRSLQQLQAAEDAFTAIPRGCSVATWGDAQCSGDSRAAQDQLAHVQHIIGPCHCGPLCRGRMYAISCNAA